MNGRTGDGRMDGWMNGWMDGRIDGRMDGRTDVGLCAQVDLYNYVLIT